MEIGDGASAEESHRGDDLLGKNVDEVKGSGRTIGEGVHDWPSASTKTGGVSVAFTQRTERVGAQSTDMGGRARRPWRQDRGLQTQMRTLDQLRLGAGSCEVMRLTDDDVGPSADAAVQDQLDAAIQELGRVLADLEKNLKRCTRTVQHTT